MTKKNKTDDIFPDTNIIIELLDDLSHELLEFRPRSSSSDFVICPLCGGRSKYRVTNAACDKCVRELGIVCSHDGHTIRFNRVMRYHKLRKALPMICRHYKRMYHTELKLAEYADDSLAGLIKRQARERYILRLTRLKDFKRFQPNTRRILNNMINEWLFSI